MVLLEEFNRLLKDLENEVNTSGLNLSFALLGTPLHKSPFLLVGNNWGGGMDIAPQNKMLDYNDILREENNSTYKGYIDFFKILFDQNEKLSTSFLEQMIYTNGNLIRTPNEKKDYKGILEYGIRISPRYLKQVIDLVEPQLIICFGNSEISATSAIFKSMMIDGDFWKMDDNSHIQTSNKWATYKFIIKKDNKAYIIYSFPHSSKFNLWCKELEANRNFIDLRNEITPLLKIDQ